MTVDWLSELLFYNVYSGASFSYMIVSSLNGSLKSRLYVNYEGYATNMVSHPFTGYFMQFKLFSHSQYVFCSRGTLYSHKLAHYESTMKFTILQISVAI